MMNRCTEGLSSAYLTQLDALIETISKWDNYEYYVEKLRKFRPNLVEKGRSAYDPSPNHFNTLIHGDIWKNNVMVAYNEDGQLDNAVLIDFQFNCWTSPAMDLHYFFNTSLNEDVRMNDLDELIQYYHGELVDALKRLGYQKHVPTLLEFHVQYAEKIFYGSYSTWFP